MLDLTPCVEWTKSRNAKGYGQVFVNNKNKRAHRHVWEGEKHGRAKLKESEVIIIKQRLRNNESVAQIARDFGVPRGTIDSIKRGNNWGWLQC